FRFWDTLNRWPDRKDRRIKRILLLNVGLMVMTFWLLQLSHSATSVGCLIVGWVTIAVLRSRWANGNPGVVKVGAPAALATYVVLELTIDPVTMVADLFGRDATLHGRIGIWETVLALQTNPLLG